jgi:hypothetical protein
MVSSPYSFKPLQSYNMPLQHQIYQPTGIYNATFFYFFTCYSNDNGNHHPIKAIA